MFLFLTISLFNDRYKKKLLQGPSKVPHDKQCLTETHTLMGQCVWVIVCCLTVSRSPTSSTVYEHISLVGFLAGTFLKVGWKIFLVICWSFWYPTWKSPTLVLVDDIFCLLHTLNFGKVFFCLNVCIIPTKECFLKPSEVPVSYVYIHISEVPVSYVYIHISEVPVSYVYIWSPNKGCLRCCYQGPIVWTYNGSGARCDDLLYSPWGDHNNKI